MYSKIAEIGVLSGIFDGREDKFQLFRGLKMECGEESQILGVQVFACVLEEVEFVGG